MRWKFGLGGLVGYDRKDEYLRGERLGVGRRGSLNREEEDRVLELGLGVGRGYGWKGGGGLEGYVGVKVGREYGELKWSLNVFERNKDRWGL